MSPYYLRDVDPDLWRKVKARVAYDDLTIRRVICELLKLYVTHGLDHLKASAKGK